jgi:hypothetical protein
MTAEQTLKQPSPARSTLHAFSQSPLWLFTILTAAIFTVEVVVMGVLSMLPSWTGLPGALLDATLLVLLLFPVLHFCALRPLVQHIREREQAERALQAAHDTLEARVRERTTELWQANAALQAEIVERQRVAQERERLIGELQSALAEVKELSGLLPICADCKKIKDDGGYWNQLEVYVTRHSKAQFSHGLCPDCVKKYYAELESLKL